MNAVPGSSLLLVEDDVELREDILSPILREAGFAVTAAGTALQAYQHLAMAAFDLVLLDVGLPDMDGFSMLEHLRQKPLPVVMLTGQGSAGDQVRGLNLGAHAYLTKPVDPDVLVATLHNVLRRADAASPAQAPALQAQGSAGDGDAWQLESEGWGLISPNRKRLKLNKSERALMLRLWSQADQLVTREELIGQITDNVFDYDSHSFDVVISRLREKVRQGTGMALPLWTVRGAGYIFKLRPAEAAEIT